MSDFDDFLESANAEFDTVATKQADPKYARTRFTASRAVVLGCGVAVVQISTAMPSATHATVAATL